jgi:hypothetical protein
MMHAAYIFMLAAVLAGAAARMLFSRPSDVRAFLWCLAAVALNWAVNTAYVLYTGDTDPELFFFLTDSLSLGAVVYAGRSHTLGALLASSYLGQLIAHAAHFAGQDDPYYYWQLLTVLGYGQLLLLGAWIFAPAYRDANHEPG